MIYVALLAFEALRVLLRLMLVAFCWHLVRTALTALRRRKASGVGPLPERPPPVTVQLPMRNEYYVAERIIDMASALDYPRERLEIQVLDDSDDASRERVEKRVEALAEDGLSIRHLTRDAPEGHKAGALNAGLAQARGELIAIFDADCMPAPDFLEKTVPHFADPSVGFVQVRWEFENRGRSLLTRVQAIILDGLFAVEQYVRGITGRPVQFNGTNGVWRRECLEDAGSWSGSSLTEDVDLSFRAYLRGWKAVHLREYTVVTEIPASMGSFRIQQKRWAMGSAQALRRLGAKVLRAPISLGAKLSMLMHLGRHAVYPLILLTCLAAPLTTLYRMPHLIDYGVPANTALMLVIMASLVLFYGVGQAVLGQPLHRVVWVPLIVLLAMGMSLVYTIAFIRGLFQRGGRFVRTPKQGDRAVGALGPRYRSPPDPWLILEILLGAAQLYFAVRAFSYGIVSYGTFFGAVGISLLWVGLGSLIAREA